MITHLFGDDKFVDITIENFESVSNGVNKYIVFSNNNDLNYVSNNKAVVVPNSAYKLDLDFIYDDCQLLVIHFLNPLKLFIIKNKPSHVEVLWSVWGGDAYDHFQDLKIFEPITDKFRRKSFYQWFRSSFLYSLYHILRYRVRPISSELELLKEINFISTVLPNEFEIIQARFDLDATYIDYSYGINNFSTLELQELGNSVLIGNSATPSNNHLDIFEIIKESKRNLIVPLSYGAYDYKNYKELVISEGMRVFKSSFTPIEEFMPSKDYIDLMLSCNSVIMYHIRQQALGNIFMALFQGMRVFLNSRSLTYSYLETEGMIIFDLKQDYKLIGVELEEEQKRINKEIVLNLRGREVIKGKISSIIDLYNSLDND